MSPRTCHYNSGIFCGRSCLKIVTKPEHAHQGTEKIDKWSRMFSQTSADNGRIVGENVLSNQKGDADPLLPFFSLISGCVRSTEYFVLFSFSLFYLWPCGCRGSRLWPGSYSWSTLLKMIELLGPPHETLRRHKTNQ